MSETQYHYIRPDVILAIEDGTLMTSVPGEATRYGYAAAIVTLAMDNPKIVVLNADVAKSIKT
ncbi:MAG: hypothetical protein P1S60_18035, partial [Anaerolineae bacterium]|nr:hypothetical protein [Anaerolineae bacterium]